MKLQWPRLNRKVHYWAAIICAVPVLIVILSGIPLLLKKEISWIQPSTMKGHAGTPTIDFPQILTAAASVPQAEIKTWEDISRIDIRPGKGIIKILGNNQWEVQIDHRRGEVLQVAYRRSDFIESLHDGSFFHPLVKLWVFLPSALILLVLWVTGIYLFLKPLMVRRQRRKQKSLKNSS